MPPSTAFGQEASVTATPAAIPRLVITTCTTAATTTAKNSTTSRSSTSNPPVFSKFPDLPRELRNMIMGFASAEPQRHLLHCDFWRINLLFPGSYAHVLDPDDDQTRKMLALSSPSLLHINQETRVEVIYQNKLERHSGVTSMASATQVNFDKDIFIAPFSMDLVWMVHLDLFQVSSSRELIDQIQHLELHFKEDKGNFHLNTVVPIFLATLLPASLKTLVLIGDQGERHTALFPERTEGVEFGDLIPELEFLTNRDVHLEDLLLERIIVSSVTAALEENDTEMYEDDAETYEDVENLWGDYDDGTFGDA